MCDWRWDLYIWIGVAEVKAGFCFGSFLFPFGIGVLVMGLGSRYH